MRPPRDRYRFLARAISAHLGSGIKWWEPPSLWLALPSANKQPAHSGSHQTTEGSTSTISLLSRFETALGKCISCKLNRPRRKTEYDLNGMTELELQVGLASFTSLSLSMSVRVLTSCVRVLQWAPRTPLAMLQVFQEALMASNDRGVHSNVPLDYVGSLLK